MMLGQRQLQCPLGPQLAHQQIDAKAVSECFMCTWTQSEMQTFRLALVCHSCCCS